MSQSKLNPTNDFQKNYSDMLWTLSTTNKICLQNKTKSIVKQKQFAALVMKLLLIRSYHAICIRR